MNLFDSGAESRAAAAQEPLRLRMEQSESALGGPAEPCQWKKGDGALVRGSCAVLRGALLLQGPHERCMVPASSIKGVPRRLPPLCAVPLTALASFFVLVYSDQEERGHCAHPT